MKTVFLFCLFILSSIIVVFGTIDMIIQLFKKPKDGKENS